MRSLALLAAIFAVAACDDQAMRGGHPEAGNEAEREVLSAPTPGRYVYAMTNEADGNAVLAFEHADGGELVPIGRFETGGVGTGPADLPDLVVVDGIDPLMSQGSLHRIGGFLLAVNAGSGSVTVFDVLDDGALELVDVEDVGAYPVTIAHRENRVWVGLSPGPDGKAGVAQLAMNELGELRRVGDDLPLASHPADLHVSDDGRFLVASEVLDDALVVWPLDRAGMAGAAVRTPSAGPGPFGLETRGGVLVVTEAAPMMPGQASVSTWRILADGRLEASSPSVPNGQSATCWVQLTPGQKRAIVSNTESGTLSVYRLYDDGELVLANEAIAEYEGAPIDLAITRHGQFLYTLLGDRGGIAVHKVGEALRRIGGGEDLGLPEKGAQGIVAW